ncbi:integration host factor subunit beta [Thiohalocapsa marina]|uniref:Integration host factor subunit beta n=1 Tax=Thiohalocapsa marina TaxID=424902 RepID=A0A5M8FLG7_9GAMM|nr:integration host factor subunit beta [Thiohalocapsa marina]KAA6185609.1 integration host factor subunit beta [Thiohalocapsa marina]
MTRAELIERLTAQQPHLTETDIELAVRTIIDQLSDALAGGERIEVRGFGSFTLRYRSPRIGRNPKSGEPVSVDGKHIPYFRPGKELRDRVNAAAHP